MRRISTRLEPFIERGKVVWSPPCGTGVRRFIDTTGPRMDDLRLFYVPTMEEFRVEKEYLQDVTELDLQPELTIERLKAKLDEYDRNGWQCPRVRVAEIISELEGETLW
jgi:hypothetical protein